MNTSTPATHVAWPVPLSSTAAPMRWVLTGDPRNCSGLPCPPDTFCMRPEPFLYPNYCVHKLAINDVPQLLAKGPAMVYCEDIGQAVVAVVLFLIFLVQLAHLFVYYRRSTASVTFYKQNQARKAMNSSIETELRPLIRHIEALDAGHTNMTYEPSSAAASTYEPSYMPFHQV